MGEPRGDGGISRLGSLGNVRLRIVARWIVWGEERAERALLSGVIIWDGGPRMAPLGRAGWRNASSSVGAAIGSFPTTSARVSANKRPEAQARLLGSLCPPDLDNSDF